MEVNPYASAMAHVLPGTFVPDVAPHAPASRPLPETPAAGAASFKDTVKSLLEGVNDKLVAAGAQSQDLATGKTNNLDGVIKSVEEAGLAFQFTMAVRNKLMEAYTEVNQMNF